jgi:hypothetical protein
MSLWLKSPSEVRLDGIHEVIREEYKDNPEIKLVGFSHDWYRYSFMQNEWERIWSKVNDKMLFLKFRAAAQSRAID